ncbi:MAG: hypothetical protein SF051_05400 [Elusimicrobiota bacterium]|nr:hypothetical protein [Elusimicrobiota bacterium]
MRRSYREHLAIKAVARAIVEARAEEWSPLLVERERVRAKRASRADEWGGIALRGRTPSRSVVCPARMTRRHPDPKLRQLGQEQADALHAAWGPCCACRQGFVPARMVTPRLNGRQP